MPTYKIARIDEVNIANQWRGDFDPYFFHTKNLQGFPGLHVPSSLIRVASDMTGDGFLIDLEKAQWPELRRLLPGAFRNKAAGKGPMEGGDWALYTNVDINEYPPLEPPAYKINGDPTMSGHTRWMPSTANGLAYRIGRRLADNSVVPYELPYPFTDLAITGYGSYWIQFLISLSDV